MKQFASRVLVSNRAARSGQGVPPRSVAAIAVLLLLVAPLSSAQIPDEMAYSGRLTDGSGAALSGPVNVQLRIFDHLEDGGVHYIEDHADVELDEIGFFQVPLGGGVVVVGTFEATLFTGMDRYLEVAVDGATLSPRQKMGSVPYAVQAEIAQQSGQADAANDAARLEGSTLSEILAMVPSDTEWTAEAGQVTTTDQVVIGAAASPAAETSLHVQGDTVVQGRLIAGSAGLDVASEITDLQERVAALGSPAPIRFEACSDGLTVADHQTGLLWERKTGTYEIGSQASRIFCGPTGCPNPHDVNNIYSFDEVSSNFLKRLNGTMDPVGEPGCFAGRCDWDLPKISELQTLMIGPDSAPGQHQECTYPGPCIDPEFAAIAGPTFTSAYWSKTESPTIGEIYYAGFDAGSVQDTPTSDINWVRAVREGGCIPAAEYDGAAPVTCADGECLGVFDAASWRDAEAFCQSWGGTLAMIRSESKNEAVRAAIGAGSAYIGLHEGGGTCNRQFCWADDLYGNPSLPYTAWASGEPAAVTCGYMEASDGLWRAEESPCNDGSERRFVCERPEVPEVTCSDGECLGLFRAAPWNEAQSTCASWGGSLAMIRSQSKNDAVRALVGTGEAYIGLHEGGGPCNGNFCWVDDLYANPSLPYTAWAPGQPAVGKCGYIDGADGLWRIDGSGTNGGACNDENERRFVCERPE